MYIMFTDFTEQVTTFTEQFTVFTEQVTTFTEQFTDFTEQVTTFTEQFPDFTEQVTNVTKQSTTLTEQFKLDRNLQTKLRTTSEFQISNATNMTNQKTTHKISLAELFLV